MKNELPNKNDEPFMKVNIHLQRERFLKVKKNALARKYAQLKKTRHHRTGKQHSVDDDEDDIGMMNDPEKNVDLDLSQCL